MDDLPKNHFAAILADPPWRFQTWSQRGKERSAERHYSTMGLSDLMLLPVREIAAKDSVLFLWISWPMLPHALRLIRRWDFEYKTCAFAWIKADARQVEMFHDEITAAVSLGYWTRSNSEVCLLATRGRPRRLAADVRQAIIAPRREHSRKPEGIHDRIQRLVAGPYLELFARQCRPGWTAWGNEIDKYQPVKWPTDNAGEAFAEAWDSMWRRPFHKPELL